MQPARIRHEPLARQEENPANISVSEKDPHTWWSADSLVHATLSKIEKKTIAHSRKIAGNLCAAVSSPKKGLNVVAGLEGIAPKNSTYVLLEISKHEGLWFLL